MNPSRSQVSLPSLRVLVGHAQLAGGASVQRGACCRINVDLDVGAVSIQQALVWLAVTELPSDERRRLKSEVAAGRVASAILEVLATSFGDDLTRARAGVEVTLRAENLAQARLLDSLRTLSDEPLRLSAALELQSTSMTPTVLTAFAKLVRLEFTDGHHSSFFDFTVPVAASITGVRAAAHLRGEPKLRVTHRTPPAGKK
jgi:hypothetical protein